MANNFVCTINGTTINNTEDMARVIMRGNLDLFKQIEEAQEQLPKLVVVDHLNQVQVSERNLYRLPCAGNSSVFEDCLDFVREQPHKIRTIENIKVFDRNASQLYEKHLKNGDRIAIRETFTIYEYVK